MKLFWDNKIGDTILTASSTKTGYDIGNLKIPQLSKVFSFDGNSGSIVLSFSEATEIGYCIIDKGNMSDSVIGIFQGNNTDDWSDPSFSDSFNITETALWIELDSEYKYYRIVLSDDNLTDLEFGYISIGPSGLQLPGVDPEADLYYNTTSENTISLGGQVYGDTGYEYLETAFNFPQIGEDNIIIRGKTCASRKDILKMWKAVLNITPIWAFLWSDNLDEHAPVFCILNNNSMQFKKLGYGKYYSTSINLRQVL